MFDRWVVIQSSEVETRQNLWDSAGQAKLSKWGWRSGWQLNCLAGPSALSDYHLNALWLEDFLFSNPNWVSGSFLYLQSLSAKTSVRNSLWVSVKSWRESLILDMFKVNDS